MHHRLGEAIGTVNSGAGSQAPPTLERKPRTSAALHPERPLLREDRRGVDAASGGGNADGRSPRASAQRNRRGRGFRCARARREEPSRATLPPPLGTEIALLGQRPCETVQPTVPRNVSDVEHGGDSEASIRGSRDVARSHLACDEDGTSAFVRGNAGEGGRLERSRCSTTPTIQGGCFHVEIRRVDGATTTLRGSRCLATL